jgi:N6-L-threonylcarbamoyladenine synthase
VFADGRLLSSIVASQQVHAHFGGVVPELASRAHERVIVPTVEEALRQADIGHDDVRAIAATYGPGLAGSLLVGLSFAKAYALARGIPFVGVNHLEGHLYSVFIDGGGPAFPYLCLVVSGGHTELVLVEEGFQHRILGRTRDDAAGEAFDKVAKLMDLGYPGGPVIDRMAANGDPAFVRFPRSRPSRFDYSFSGIKTSVLYYLNKFDESDRLRHMEKHASDLCASFQDAVVAMLLDGVREAIEETGIRDLAIVGGVSANSALRRGAERLAGERKVRLHVPKMAYCMDNAAMIAVTAAFKLSAGKASSLSMTAEPALRLG